MDEEQAEVVRRELMLHQPKHRVRPADVRALLHPDFVEFGASGRRWDAASTTASLATEDPLAPPIEATELTPTRLADDVVLLIHRSAAGAGIAPQLSLDARPGPGVAPALPPGNRHTADHVIPPVGS